MGHKNGKLAQDIDVDVRVSNLAGQTWELSVKSSATVAHVKVDLEKLSGIPKREQRIALGLIVCRDSQPLSDGLRAAPRGKETKETAPGELPARPIIELMLVRRSPEQAKWIEKVTDKPSSLKEAPAEMLADPEVVMAAFLRDPAMLFCASEALMDTSWFIQDAIRQSGGPEEDELQECVWEPGRLAWMKAPAHAKLVLRAAFHSNTPDLAAVVLQHPVVAKAKDDMSKVHLSVEPCMSPELARQLLQSLPKQAVCMCLRPSALRGSLQLGMELLALNARAETHHFRYMLGGAPSTESLENKSVLKPGMFAMLLFKKHEEELQGNQEAFDALSLHLDGEATPDVETCCSLIRAYLAHGHQVTANKLFSRHHEDSDSFMGLFVDGSLPLTLLPEKKNAPSLMRAILQSFGGPEDVLAAVATDRGSIRSLLRDKKAAKLCTHANFGAALKLAVEQEREQLGRIIFRAVSAAEPRVLPGCPVPLPWLDELRPLEHCNWLAVEFLLLGLEKLQEEELERRLRANWGLVNWTSSSAEQTQRAVELLDRAGLAGGQDLETAFRQLPLGKLDNPMFCARQGLPEHAPTWAAVAMLKAAGGSAEEIAAKQGLIDALQRATQRADDAPGRELFEAMVAARPKQLFDFHIPLSWLPVLRRNPAHTWLAVEMLLSSLELTSDADVSALLKVWNLVDWPACDGQQLERAVELVARFGLASELNAADTADLRASKRQRLELRSQLSGLLHSLPLERGLDARLLLKPGLPPQTMAILAAKKAEIAESSARDAALRSQAAEETATQAAKAAKQARRRADEAASLAQQAEQEAASASSQAEKALRKAERAQSEMENLMFHQPRR